MVHEPGQHEGDAGDRAVTPTRRRRWRGLFRGPFDWKLAVASLAIALGLAMIVFAISRSVTGDEVTKLPDQIESISPVPDAVQVPSQTNIVVDLVDGYAGELTIDGVTYPTQRPRAVVDTGEDVLPAGVQVDVREGVVYDPGSFTLTFTPGEDVGFDEWDAGNHIVSVLYWEERDGEVVDGTVRGYTWTFNIV